MGVTGETSDTISNYAIDQASGALSWLGRFRRESERIWWRLSDSIVNASRCNQSVGYDVFVKEFALSLRFPRILGCRACRVRLFGQWG